MDEEKATDPMAIVIAVFSGITLIIDIPPLIWHLKNRNIAACCLISWIVLLNFFAFINAIIWSTDDVDKWFNGQGLCDIQVKLFVGATIAIPLALLRIIRSLALVLCTKGGTGLTTAKERRKRATIDLITCLLIPALFMILHYIVQPNRYYIWRVSGCQVSIDNSWVSVVILLIWPLLITLIDSYYAGMILVGSLLKSLTLPKVLSFIGYDVIVKSYIDCLRHHIQQSHAFTDFSYSHSY